MRLDVYLADKNLYKSRSKAAEAIKKGLVTVNGKREKASYEVAEGDVIESSSVDRFVSRAGEQLAFALDGFGVDPKGLCLLDIGASTGGFTDCLLKNGAAFVYALDVGHGQIDPAIACDERVKVYEGFNAREAKKSDFDREINMITMDVSFVSQTLIYPACADILPAGGKMITLIKPQFEAGRKHIGKGGIVRDADGSVIREILQKIDIAASENGFTRIKTAVSPIAGGDGNTEYLALFIKGDGNEDR